MALFGLCPERHNPISNCHFATLRDKSPFSKILRTLLGLLKVSLVSSREGIVLVVLVFPLGFQGRPWVSQGRKILGHFEVFLWRVFICGLISTQERQKDPRQEVQQYDLSTRQEFGECPSCRTHVAVMFSCRTLTRSAKVSCRTLPIAEPKVLNSEKDYLAEPWNAVSFRKCPSTY